MQLCHCSARHSMKTVDLIAVAYHCSAIHANDRSYCSCSISIFLDKHCPAVGSLSTVKTVDRQVHATMKYSITHSSRYELRYRSIILSSTTLVAQHICCIQCNNITKRVVSMYLL